MFVACIYLTHSKGPLLDRQVFTYIKTIKKNSCTSTSMGIRCSKLHLDDFKTVSLSHNILPPDQVLYPLSTDINITPLNPLLWGYNLPLLNKKKNGCKSGQVIIFRLYYLCYTGKGKFSKPPFVLHITG